jgi:sugar fermentation stimulation protein A
MIKIGNTWIGVNTNKANDIAFEILKNEFIPRFSKPSKILREIKFGNSRIDLYLERANEKIFIEVKNVTYRYGDFALFPDAVTTRGQKHLRELMNAIESGYKAAMFFIIQRTDTKIFAPAWNIDPAYGKLLIQAYNKGVEIYPIQIKITPDKHEPVKILDFTLNPNDIIGEDK